MYHYLGVWPKTSITNGDILRLHAAVLVSRSKSVFELVNKLFPWSRRGLTAKKLNCLIIAAKGRCTTFVPKLVFLGRQYQPNRPRGKVFSATDSSSSAVATTDATSSVVPTPIINKTPNDDTSSPAAVLIMHKTPKTKAKCIRVVKLCSKKWVRKENDIARTYTGYIRPYADKYETHVRDQANSKREDDGDSVCAVCNFPVVDELTLSCKHIFCSACIQYWFAQSGTRKCPTCRGVTKNMTDKHKKVVAFPPPQPAGVMKRRKSNWKRSKKRKRQNSHQHIDLTPSSAQTPSATTLAPNTKFDSPKDLLNMFDGSPTKVVKYALDSDPERIKRLPILRRKIRENTAQRTKYLQHQFDEKLSKCEKKIQVCFLVVPVYSLKYFSHMLATHACRTKFRQATAKPVMPKGN